MGPAAADGVPLRRALRNTRRQATGSLFSWAARSLTDKRSCRRDGLLLGSGELVLASAIMESLAAGIPNALAKTVQELKELRAATTRGSNVADENSAEQGVQLEEMDGSGMRNRLASGLASGQASRSADDNPDSPSTTSGDSGTLTPGTDDNLETQGMTLSKKLSSVIVLMM